MEIQKTEGDEQPVEGTSGLKQGLGGGLFFTFYLEKPDEENEIGIYRTFEEALKAAKDGCFGEFCVCEIALRNVRKFRSDYIELADA